jgi:ELWxxDGT repeat protein
MGYFTAINELVFFIASKGYNDYIYRSDGTEEGTFIIQPAFGLGINEPQPAFTYKAGNVYFFNRTAEEYTGAPYKLWRMFYADSSPQPVKEFAGVDDYYDQYEQEMISFNGLVYTFGRFQPESGHAGGFKFIKSNGTESGTTVIKDFGVPTMGSNPAEMVTVNNLIYFRTQPENTDSGPQAELWRTDGTTEGTVKLADTGPGYEMEPVGNKLFFTATADYGWGLYVTEGTPETTVLLAGSVDSNLPYGLTNVNGVLYYYNVHGELWRTNGSEPVLVRDLRLINSVTNVNGQAFVLAGLPGNGLELWRTNGVGTLIRVKTIRTDYAEPADYNGTTNIGRFFYFIADDGVHGHEIWRSDGTALGTYMMFNINEQDETGSFSSRENDIRALTVSNNKLYFSAKDNDGAWAGITLPATTHI